MRGSGASIVVMGFGVDEIWGSASPPPEQAAVISSISAAINAGALRRIMT